MMVMIVTMILGLGSVMFINRSSDDMDIGASRRDSGLAQGLAETAATLVGVRFKSDDIAISDIDGDGVMDRALGYADLTLAPAILPLPYAFYTEAGNSTPPIQRVATGEASNAHAAIATQTITAASTEFSVNDLFISNTIHPILYRQTENGLTLSANDWTGETAKNKVAVWLEYELNPIEVAWLDIYVAASAQNGRAKAYVRKFIGSYTDEIGGMVPPLSESGLHGT